MSGSSLPDTLGRLSVFMPDLLARFEMVNRGAWSVKIVNRAGDTRIWQGHPLFEVALEYALREEIEARGWVWCCQVYRDGLGYAVDVQKVVAGKRFAYAADSSALALCLALLAALEATP